MDNRTQNRGLWVALSAFVIVVLVTGSCSAGFVVGRFLPLPGRQPLAATAPGEQAQTDNATDNVSASPEELEALFVPFWQAWNLVHEQYVDQPVDDEALMRGAISGMLDSLGDPHTSYMDPESFSILNSSLQGESTYEGIGAWVDPTADYLTIISPMPNSPAQAAGLRNGDKIIAIDGEDMTGLDGEVVRQKVLGPAGTTVRLTILREGQEPFDVDVTRADITVPSLDYRMLDEQIGYVQLFVFASDTKDQLRQAIRELLDQKPIGLILDLRNNGGGYLDTAVEVASEFMNEGVILYEEYGDGTRKTFEAERGGLATDIPMVVLINEGSASASEIVAGAIQDNQRGTLVGTTSFGKGSVQIPTTLKNKQGAVRITVARWLTPNGRTIHQTGLTPDVVIEFTDEDLEANRDVQLDKAIEILLQGR